MLAVIKEIQQLEMSFVAVQKDNTE